MAKITKRLNVKGKLDLSENTFTEFDKDEGEIIHKLTSLLIGFDKIEDVTLSASYDHIIVPED